MSLSTCKLEPNLGLQLAADIAVPITGTPYSTTIVHSQSQNENVIAQVSAGT